MDTMDLDESLETEKLEELFSDSLFYYAPLNAFQLVQHDDVHLKGKSPSKGWLARFFSLAQESATQCPLPLEKMLSHQTEPLTVPLLKTSAALANQAINMFKSILLYAEHKLLPLNDALKAAYQLLRDGLARAEMKDELYMQLLKQARGNGSSESRVKVWELFYLVTATMPPSSEYSSLLMHFISGVCRDDEEIKDVSTRASETWAAVKRSVRSGPRQRVPTMEEIDVKISKRPHMKTIVFFLDGSCEDLLFDIGTTVHEAVGKISALIGLINSESFSLFESRRSKVPNKGWVHSQLYEHSYIADVLNDFSERAVSGETSHLVFKKTTFRESDAQILESQFLNLSYLQAQHDLLRGNYPVGSDEGAKLCAFQLFSEFGNELPQEKDVLYKAIEDFTREDAYVACSKESWMHKVLENYRGLHCESREDARSGFLNLLRSLPYGMAIFFEVGRMQDPLGLLPSKAILGINKSGLHLLKCLPKQYLTSVDFRDISHFGFCSKSVFFKMKVAGRLLEFQFASEQGVDICMALKTHIGDAATREDSSELHDDKEGCLAHVDFGQDYQKHLIQMQEEIETAKTRQDRLNNLQQSRVQDIQSSRACVDSTLRSVSKLEATKRGVQEQATVIGGEIFTLRHELLSLSRSLPCSIVSCSTEHSPETLDKLLSKEAEIRQSLKKASEENAKVENKLVDFESQRSQEIRSLQDAVDSVVSQNREAYLSKDSCIASLVEQIANMKAMLHVDAKDAERFAKAKGELADLRNLKSEIENRDRAFATQIEEQKDRIDQLERTCCKEQHSRKKIFNKLQDLKGNIRVYARVRPVLDIERKKGQSFALRFPDDVSVAHAWKRDDRPKEYTFDGVFLPEASQAKVFSHTQDLIQSAIDGYNVCIFAYGQTGSGKTFTIYGNANNPGLTPQGIRKLFELLNKNSNKSSFSVACYMLELYRDSLTDLLSDKKTKGSSSSRRYSEVLMPSVPLPRLSMPRLSEYPQTLESRRLSEVPSQKEKLEIKRDSAANQMIYVQGATMVDVQSADDLLATFERGQRRRHVAATQMNRESSRSHLVMSIVIEATDLQTLTQTRGKLTFVDLAGSERLKKSGSAGEQLKEAQTINKSLSALGDVISSLSRGDPHIPYRNHKLTLLMSDSIGGNSKTLMFVNVSPTDVNLDETQNSLQYASRVRTIKNTASKETNKETALLKKRLGFWKMLESRSDETSIREMVKEYL